MFFSRGYGEESTSWWWSSCSNNFIKLTTPRDDLKTRLDEWVSTSRKRKVEVHGLWDYGRTKRQDFCARLLLSHTFGEFCTLLKISRNVFPNDDDDAADEHAPPGPFGETDRACGEQWGESGQGDRHEVNFRPRGKTRRWAVSRRWQVSWPRKNIW